MWETSTTSLKTVTLLQELALEKGLILHTNFIYLYNNAIEEISKLISQNSLEPLKAFLLKELDLGQLELMWTHFGIYLHMISILTLLIDEDPYKILSTGRLDENSSLKASQCFIIL